MGLDTSHDCWHGAYSAFMQWREKIAELAGLPPLVLMQGFYDANDPPLRDPFWNCDTWQVKRIKEQLPIKWSCLKRSALYPLLYHSDCDGVIPWRQCEGIARELEKLLPLMDAIPEQQGHIGIWREKTQKFIDGLRLAASRKEHVYFH